MARGLPVVATSLAIEGMGIAEGIDCLVADSSGDFAKSICNLYENNELWTRVSESAYLHAKNNWGFDELTQKFEKILQSLMA